MEETSVPSRVTTTAVAVTLNAKAFGLDAFVKFEETVEFSAPATELDALVKREEIVQLITEQLVAVIKDAAATVKAAAPALPVAPVVPQAPAGAYQGQPAPAGNGAAAVLAVANGAAAGGLDWRSAPDRFDSGKTVRFLSAAAFPSESMKAAAATWLSAAGFNPAAFDIWDERGDAEAGRAISSVCNIKVKKDYHQLVPADVVATQSGGVKAVARAKFNHDGSLFFYWSKDAEAAIKYDAFRPLRGELSAPAAEEGF